MPSTANLRRIPAPQAEPEVVEPATEPTSLAPWLAVVAEKVKTIRYGVVQIVVHDSKIMQIERTERTRFGSPATGPRALAAHIRSTGSTGEFFQTTCRHRLQPRK